MASSVDLDVRPPRVCEMSNPDGTPKNGCPHLDEEPFWWTGQVVDAARGLIYETQQSQLVVLDTSLKVLAKVKGFHTLRAPVLMAGIVYGLDRDAVVAINPDQRRLLWRVQIPNAGPERLNSIGAAAGSLWMRWQDTRLLQLDPATRHFREHPEVGRSVFDITSDPTSSTGLLVSESGALYAQLQVVNGTVSVAREFGHDGYGERLQLSCNGQTALHPETDQGNVTTWYLTDQRTRQTRSTAGIYPHMHYPTECARPLVFGWSDCDDYCSVYLHLEGVATPIGRIVLPHDKGFVTVDLVPRKDLVVVVAGDGYYRNSVATYRLSALLLARCAAGPDCPSSRLATSGSPNDARSEGHL